MIYKDLFIKFLSCLCVQLAERGCTSYRLPFQKPSGCSSAPGATDEDSRHEEALLVRTRARASTQLTRADPLCQGLQCTLRGTLWSEDITT